MLGGVQWTLLAAQMLRSFRHVTQTVSWPTAMTLNPADALEFESQISGFSVLLENGHVSEGFMGSVFSRAGGALLLVL